MSDEVTIQAAKRLRESNMSSHGIEQIRWVVRWVESTNQFGQPIKRKRRFLQTRTRDRHTLGLGDWTDVPVIGVDE